MSINNSDSRHASRLRAAGLRATAPRLAILAELETDRRHPDAEMLHETLVKELPTLSLSTVYAALDKFSELGLIRRVPGNSGKLRVDGTPEEHDHAVCRCCGAVYDVPLQDRPNMVKPPALPDGLQLMNIHLEYEVVCGDCSARHGQMH